MSKAEQNSNGMPEAHCSEPDQSSRHVVAMTNRDANNYTQDVSETDSLTRRGFLGVSSAALAASGLLANNLAAQEKEQSKSGYPPTDDHSRSDPGPTNTALDAANPDTSAPPATDAGGVQTFKYPFSFSNKRLHEGGWSREVTQRELAVSKSIAGVDIALRLVGYANCTGTRPPNGHSCSTEQLALRVSMRMARAW
jgi:hypothetical protein